MIEGLDPEEQLALVYAPASMRARLTLLLALDHRLNGVVHLASEPMLAQIRMAWWRDQLASLAQGAAAPAEPLLSMIAANPEWIAPAAALVDAWDGILTDPAPISPDEARAATLLGEGATLGARTGMTGWALTVRGRAEEGARSLKMGLANKWPRAFRAQRLMAHRALADMDGSARPLGHPRRVARIIWWGLSGR